MNALALVRTAAPPTPLEASTVAGHEVLLKREDTGPNGAFKWRGALCSCEALRVDGATGVVMSSTGNHGAATAWAAGRLGMSAHAVVPENASERKCALIADRGAELNRVGGNVDEAAHAARRLAGELGLPFMEDGVSEAQLAGTGTNGAELADAGADLVIRQLACGALAGGLSHELKLLERPPAVLGVQSNAFPRLGALWHGQPDPGISSAASFAGGLADSRNVESAFGACRPYLDDVIAVSDEVLRDAIRELDRATGIVVEGAGAATVAALLTRPGVVPDGGRVVLILRGANLDDADARDILDR